MSFPQSLADRSFFLSQTVRERLTQEMRANGYRETLGECGKSRKECQESANILGLPINNKKKIFSCIKNGGNCPFED